MAHILLYGPPGSGKTTLGNGLAKSLRLPFVDLDQAVESRSGMSISDLMERDGENGFRELESSAFREQLGRPDSVIALGGGTLLRPENRSLAEVSGRVICLRADASQLGQRLRNDPQVRPLLAEDLEAKLASLLERRASHYDSFSEKLDSAAPPEDLILQLQAIIGRFHLSAMGDYDVIIEPGSLDRLGEILCERGVRRLFAVSDQNVSELYSGHILDSIGRYGMEAATAVIGAGEPHKTLATVNQLWQDFLTRGMDRKSTVIALGGGVVSDLAGFAASTFMRGINWVCVPTTVLAMVDASLGGKTGFDLPEGKNLIGSFHAPQLVLADPHVLDTLPDAEFRAGLAEIVKHGVIADPELFRACGGELAAVKEHLVELIRRAVAVKVRFIESDPYETGNRAALNLGHTVGHAVELVSGFSIRHGEAVAIGMVAEARLAERLTIARRGLAAEIAAVLLGLGLPVRIPQELSRPELIRAMCADKKKAGSTVRFALPIDIGRVQLNVTAAPEAALEEG